MTTPPVSQNGPKRVEFGWEAREVVRDIDGRPHLLLRVDFIGGRFAQHAVDPVARITSEHDQVSSWFATVSSDGTTFSAYFPIDLTHRGVLELGYFPVITTRMPTPFEPGAVVRLDRERLDGDVVLVTQAYAKDR